LQGRIASSASQRQTVAPDTCSTIPRSIASRAISALLKRESGTPRSPGSWQAIAFTSATTSGGKAPRPACAGTILQPLQPLLMEALPPPAHRLPGRVQPPGDLGVLEALGRQQHDLRS
jgi:hypothetical protein